MILTTGTFLNGLIHIGDEKTPAGRHAEKPSTGLSEQLEKFKMKMGRLKTGTPPRLDGSTINYNDLEKQDADTDPEYFSFLTKKTYNKQIACSVTYTNKKVHEIIKKNLSKSAMYSGSIKGIGPRYCPSIEDKIERFSTKDRHQLFIEPEGRDTIEIYLNGFSTSLPEEVQRKSLQCIPGFEGVQFVRPGYAIEYDYIDPTQLKHTLETKKIKKDNLNINFNRNIDILEFLSKNNLQRPKLVVGFAAETDDILKFAKEKKNRKYCDWIIANDVSKPEIGFNSEYNAVSIIDNNRVEKIEKNLKSYIANKIARKIINNFIQ